MLSDKRISRIADRIFVRSIADQTEIVFYCIDNAQTRFANSAIHQNTVESDTQVQIRAVIGKRVGVVKTNDLGSTPLTETLEKCLTLARRQPENPYWGSLPYPQPFLRLPAFIEATADCTPEQRAQIVGGICFQARTAGMIAAGLLATVALKLAVFNTLGIKAVFECTYTHVSILMRSDSSTGYASAIATDIRAIDFEALATEAIKKCERSRNPRPLKPDEYAVVLEPYATQDLIQNMTRSGLDGLSLLEGRSFLAGKIGQKIASSRVSIWDDGLDASGIPWSFDFEGVPKQRVNLIQNGIAQGVVYDSDSAFRQKTMSTGHALLSPTPSGPLACNIFFAPGEDTLQEMIRRTPRGIYISRFWYTRLIDPAKLIVTGVTRDGAYLIENGEICYPIFNLRFTQSYLEALKSIEMVGNVPRLLLRTDLARDCVPALKISSFVFTSSTLY